MVVLVRSKSGKALLVFLDGGEGFICPSSWVRDLLGEHPLRNFIQLKALPNNISEERFSPSPEYDALAAAGKRVKDEVVVEDVSEW